VITGMDVPLEAVLMLCIASAALGLWAGRRRIRPAAMVKTVDLAARRNAGRAASQAVLHGRIDQLVGPRNGWDPDIREQVRGHVAAVMRAGLRRGDSFAVGDRDAFTITIPGADERTAARIADRLRRSLAGLHLPYLSGGDQVTASFGVAAEQFGVTGDALVKRAQQALTVALEQGEDHVITASEIDEILLLPAPAIPAATAA